MKANKKLIGPFRQLLTMDNMPLKGALSDDQLEVIPNGGILVVEGKVMQLGDFDKLYEEHKDSNLQVESFNSPFVVVPGWIDAHTHICFAGSRAMDFSERNAGTPYLDIAKAGGGIWSTVQHTRAAEIDKLVALTRTRMDRLLANGITTVEVKSGYGLSVAEELKMLRAIRQAEEKHRIDVVATCLAAHIVPKDFDGDAKAYLQIVLDELEPVIKEEKLASRFDIFIEDSAYNSEVSHWYLRKLKEKGYDLTVHGDQFSVGGSKVAIDVGARSVDHLEASGDEEIQRLSKSEVIPVALPGASIGVGCAFTPARKLLDAGTSLAIASDWNPGSAPQGNLIAQASILATFQKLTTAEVLSALTFRAANALGIDDVGILKPGYRADFIAYPSSDYREILYFQGEMKPSNIWKGGNKIY